jgi:hypothetical protein
MANFNAAYISLMHTAGGYVKTPSGEKYRGICRTLYPTWAGWTILDRIKAAKDISCNEVLQDANLKMLVNNFYKRLWKNMAGDHINIQDVANHLFELYSKEGIAAILGSGKPEKQPETGTFLSMKMIEKLNSGDPGKLVSTLKECSEFLQPS